MRVLIAGASGVLGRSLVPLLVDSHEVIGLVRSESGAESVRSLGAEAIVADALDAPAVARVVGDARPDVVVNQLTAIPRSFDPRKLAQAFEPTTRLRTEGTRNLIAAAPDARHIAQSIAFAYANTGSGLKDEDAELNHGAPRAFAPIVAGVAALERATLAANGVVLRYGHFYGPGTGYASDGGIVEEIQKRKLPIVGRGRGLFSFVHVDDAAAATATVLDHEGPAVFNVVDDDPAPAAEWIAAVATLTDAKPPRRVPGFAARLAAGPWAVEYMDRLRGASSARIRERLGWRPAVASWREGFRTELGAGS